jgi:hypothetical protein
MQRAIHYARVHEVIQEPSRESLKGHETEVIECELPDQEAAAIVAKDVLCDRDVVCGDTVAWSRLGVKVEPGIPWAAEGSWLVR